MTNGVNDVPWSMALHVVLVAPEIPQNTGNIARTCAATATVLHLVKPLGFSTDDASLRRAGLDYWKDAQVVYHETLEEFFSSHEPERCYFFTTKAARPYTEARYDGDGEICLVFGRETKGLPEDLLRSHSQQCVRIPMLQGSRSLNLANSVAVAVYEALRQRGFPGMAQRSTYFKEVIT